jgi:hypothetical protein
MWRWKYDLEELYQAITKFLKNFAIKLTGLYIPLNQLQGVQGAFRPAVRTFFIG